MNSCLITTTIAVSDMSIVVASIAHGKKPTRNGIAIITATSAYFHQTVKYNAVVFEAFQINLFHLEIVSGY